MSEQNENIPFTLVERTDPRARAEGLMRAVESILDNTEIPEEARAELRSNEIVQRLKSALAQNG